MIETPSGKDHQEIQISGLFNISVQKSKKKSGDETLADVVSIKIPAGKNKEKTINYLIDIFNKGKALEWENGSDRKVLKALLGHAKNSALEKMLIDAELTFWDAGTKVFVLVPRNTGSKLLRYVVKSPIKPGEYIEKMRPGYLLAKENLRGMAADFTMTEGDVRVCDMHGVPREAFFEYILLMERVIVIKNIRKGIEERNNFLKERLKEIMNGKNIKYDFDKAEAEKYGGKKHSISVKAKKIIKRLFQRNTEIHLMLDEMVDLHHYNKFIKQKFNELYGLIESKGIYDSDEGRAAMDRNYGVRIPQKIKKNFKNTDWGLEDFRKLMESIEEGTLMEKDLQVVGFDFDGLKTRKNTELQSNRVEDVFREEIESEIRAVMGKILN